MLKEVIKTTNDTMALSSTNTVLIGDVKFSESVSKISSDGEFKVRTAETFLFELSELMKEYGVAKLDVCFDPYVYANEVNK